MSITKQAALETVHILMKHVLCGRFDEARSLFVGDVEAVNLPTAGENETLVFTLLGAEEEGEKVVVPVELEIISSEAPGKNTIPFVCVETEDGLKIDMDATLAKAVGVSPDDLLRITKEGLESIAQDIESDLETIAEEELPPELFSPDALSDSFRRGMGHVADEFDREMESIADTLENGELEWEIAWGTLCDDEHGPRRLLGSAISPLRAALALLEDHRSEDPGARRDASIRKIRTGIRTIRIVNANDWRLCECTLRDGRLTLMPCLTPKMDCPTAATRGLTSEEIERLIRAALDLDVGPTIKRSEAAVDAFVADCVKDIGFTPQVTVDWESFRVIGDSQEALAALKGLRDDLFPSVHYALFHLRKKVPLGACLESLHFRNVESRDARSITVDGRKITFSVPLVERSAGYTTEEVQARLAARVTELPVPRAEEEAAEEHHASEEDEGSTEVTDVEEEAKAEPEIASSGAEGAPVSEFRQMVASMESDMMGPMRSQMSQMFGKDFGLEVDWASMDEDQDHFTLVVSGAMGTVMGALMAMAYDPATKGRVTAAVDGLTLRYDPAVRGVALSLNDGVLSVACGGPACDYQADPAGVGEAILTLFE